MQVWLKEKINTMAEEWYDDGGQGDLEIECSPQEYCLLLREYAELTGGDDFIKNLSKLSILSDLGIPVEVNPNPWVFKMMVKEKGEK